ncbi:MAG: Smr/MutS family protein, partial [Termitinemataceae bacterium]
DDAEYRRKEHYRLVHKKPDAMIDLHGLTSDEAWDSLEHFFNQSLKMGLEKVQIIHGKGNHSDKEAVLSRLTKRYIEQNPYAGMHGHPSQADGGSGATWVVLKKSINARGK